MAELGQIVNFVGITNGTDKALMVVQFVAKNLALFFQNSKPQLAQQLLNLAIPIGDTRMLLRFTGLIPLTNRIINGRVPSSPIEYVIQRLIDVVAFLYFPFEHVYWLASHNVITLSKESQVWFSRWAVRFWAMNLSLSFIKLYFLYENEVNKESRVTEKDQRKQIVKEKNRLGLSILLNIFYYPMALHGSLNESPFSERFVALCGLGASFIEAHNAWKSVN